MLDSHVLCFYFAVLSNQPSRGYASKDIYSKRVFSAICLLIPFALSFLSSRVLRSREPACIRSPVRGTKYSDPKPPLSRPPDAFSTMIVCHDLCFLYADYFTSKYCFCLQSTLFSFFFLYICSLITGENKKILLKKGQFMHIKLSSELNLIEC